MSAPEPMSLGQDGAPCNERTIGPLTPMLVRVVARRVGGQEPHRRRNEEAVFRVQDRGIGIPAADQKQLFNAFHRGSNAGHLPGTGLGLVIVKRCVELHGGQISCESTAGQGTTFTVTLPLFENGEGKVE